MNRPDFIRGMVSIAAAVSLGLFALAAPALGVPPANSRPGPAPTNASVIGVPGGLQITWRDNSRNETAWIINDGITNRSFTVNGGSVGTRSYIWTGMEPNEYKCLRVGSYNEWGAGDYAPPAPVNYVCGRASAASVPSAPTNVKVLFCHGADANLLWTDEPDDWDFFRIYKGSTPVDLRIEHSDGRSYGYLVPAPIANVSLGVSAVKSGVESAVGYVENGAKKTCP